MTDHFETIARILRTDPDILRTVERKMAAMTGQQGVIEDIAEQNEVIVQKTLTDFGLPRDASAEEVYSALVSRIAHLDKHLYEILDKPDLSNMSDTCGMLCETAFKVFTPPKGLFIKIEKVEELLEKYPPQAMIDHFGYSSVSELIDKEGFVSVVSGLRFTQEKEWMHKFFDEAYTEIKPEDFEERDVELVVLDPKWLKVAEKFLKKKYHNVSHLKEYGVIFVIPLTLDTPGETIRLFTLILHYLHEVPFYSGLFRRFMKEEDFPTKFKSLLRGDVLEVQDAQEVFSVPGNNWLVIQRYLAKDDENDPRLFMPHINPEADHWFRAEGDLGRLSRILGKEEAGVDLGYWTGLDWAGGFFMDKDGNERLISFAFIDLIMSLVQKGEIKYLYHQQEALWNKIFSEYLGRETMNRLAEENIIKGVIKL